MLSKTHKIVEALLFAATEPLTMEQVEVCLEVDVNLKNIVLDLNYFYDEEEIPIKIHQIADGFILKTREEYEPWIKRLYQEKGNVKLSKSAMETLAIIAYKQPVTKPEIDAIRGVSSYMKTLLEKNLIEMKGRHEGPGRPLLYGTTSYFLEYFGLNSIKDLPKMQEVEELIKENDNENPTVPQELPFQDSSE